MMKIPPFGVSSALTVGTPIQIIARGVRPMRRLTNLQRLILLNRDEKVDQKATCETPCKVSCIKDSHWHSLFRSGKVMNVDQTKYQSLGRCFRAKPNVMVVDIGVSDIEHSIAARLAYRLTTERLPLLVLIDKPVLPIEGLDILKMAGNMISR